MADSNPSPDTPSGSIRQRPSFELSKWYLDVVDRDGNAYIGYAFDLRWRGLHLKGDHHLARWAPHAAVSEGGIRAQSFPVVVAGEALHWRAGPANGSWAPASDPIRADLFRSADGDIAWWCPLPRAKARVKIAGRVIEGWGYVERLDLTLPAWKLPFRKLHWGRCHTRSRCLVWISWTGGETRSLAWLDGRALDGLSMSGALPALPGIRLEVDEQVPLREGSLASTVARPFREVARLLPSSALLAEERKWLGYGRLAAGGAPEDASLIFEEVSW